MPQLICNNGFIFSVELFRIEEPRQKNEGILHPAFVDISCSKSQLVGATCLSDLGCLKLTGRFHNLGSWRHLSPGNPGHMVVATLGLVIVQKKSPVSPVKFSLTLWSEIK